jgi:hypothetical protein
VVVKPGCTAVREVSMPFGLHSAFGGNKVAPDGRGMFGF